jgi:hypothetical protein
VLDENENDIPDENEHEIEGVPEEAELEVKTDKGAADNLAAISDNESGNESDAWLNPTKDNAAEPVETTGVDNTTLEMDQQYRERTLEHKLMNINCVQDVPGTTTICPHNSNMSWWLSSGSRRDWRISVKPAQMPLLAKCNNCIIGRWSNQMQPICWLERKNEKHYTTSCS